jgi:hypothetical protein
MADDLATLFLKASRDKLVGQYWPRMQKAVEPLTEDQIWWRPNEASNSIGNLMLHLSGNVQQWIVAAFGHLEDTRNRPQEFGERAHLPKGQLIARLGSTIERADAALARLTEADLRATYTIQKYTVSGLFAVYQAVEHFALHYGQVLYIVKSVTAEDLGFYRELNPGQQAPGSPSKP